uniref:RAS p21 protein activator 3 n=1 Tax=Mus musculus TaxID=10090 RepID=D6RFE0_MOUSE
MAVEEEGLRVFQSVRIKIGSTLSPPSVLPCLYHPRQLLL